MKQTMFLIRLSLAVSLVVFYLLKSLSGPLSLDSVIAMAFFFIPAALMFMLRRKKFNQRTQVPRLSSPPGWQLLRFGELCFSNKAFTQVLEPTLSDMQKEHIEALAEGRLWKARMALVRGYASFWSAVAAQAPLSVLSLLYKVWKTTKIGS